MIKRIFEDLLVEYLETFPVVALVGCRQVGKSTLVQQNAVAKGRRYVTLDDMAMRSAAATDPDALLDWGEKLTVDEVQLAPELLRGIKQRVDQKRTPGRYLVTGSADLNTCAALSHVLAGRVGILRLPPITMFETDGGADAQPLWAAFWRQGSRVLAQAAQSFPAFDWQRILTGGFPISLTAGSWRQRSLWFESFRDTYLERDLRRISDIGHLVNFARLLELSATRTAQLLNQASLGRDAGLNAATTGRYLSILETSLLIHRLMPYYTNIGKRLVKSPKLYWSDSGLASHLLGLDPTVRPQANPYFGALFETAAIQEIKALLQFFIPQARLFYLRTHEGLEVDGIVQHGSRLLPFEIKASTTVTANDARPLERWLDLSAGKEHAMILYPGTEVKPLTKRVWAVPLTATCKSG